MAQRHPDTTTVEIFGGAETDKLHLVEADPRWPEAFTRHARLVHEAIGEVAVELHHVGSTSVPGLAAKAIIDALLVVDDITAEEDYVTPLVDAGLVLRVREPGHRLLRTPERDLHLHVHEVGDPDAADLLAFRDWLRTHPEDRELYEATKRELLTRGWTHMQAYADAKDEVVGVIRAKIRAAH